MSIPVAAGAVPSVGGLAIAVGVAGLSISVAWMLGLLDPARLPASRRVPPNSPLAPLVGVMFAALVVWLVGPSLFVRTGPALAPVEPGQPVTTATGPTVIQTPMRDLVILNASIPVVAFVVLAVGDALVRPRVGQRLGFSPTRLPRGALAGVIGTGFMLPVVYCSMVVAELVYRWVRYEHPSEHDLLRAMGETADAVIKYLAILAAVVVAPLWEELLFRGHIQTLIREGLIRVRAPLDAPGFPLDVPGAAPGVPGATRVEVERPRALESWAALVLTSLLFAGVHQPWTFPPIFCLSLCLGYAYERTGNLWAPVVMHALFNGLMTSYFLLGPGAN
jgi:membrane protease YdiL (CAAX protease family)